MRANKNIYKILISLLYFLNKARMEKIQTKSVNAENQGLKISNSEDLNEFSLGQQIKKKQIRKKSIENHDSSFLSTNTNKNNSNPFSEIVKSNKEAEKTTKLANKKQKLSKAFWFQKILYKFNNFVDGYMNKILHKLKKFRNPKITRLSPKYYQKVIEFEKNIKSEEKQLKSLNNTNDLILKYRLSNKPAVDAQIIRTGDESQIQKLIHDFSKKNTQDEFLKKNKKQKVFSTETIAKKSLVKNTSVLLEQDSDRNRGRNEIIKEIPVLLKQDSDQKTAINESEMHEAEKGKITIKNNSEEKKIHKNYTSFIKDKENIIKSPVNSIKRNLLENKDGFYVENNSENKNNRLLKEIDALELESLLHIQALEEKMKNTQSKSQETDSYLQESGKFFYKKNIEPFLPVKEDLHSLKSEKMSEKNFQVLKDIENIAQNPMISTSKYREREDSRVQNNQITPQGVDLNLVPKENIISQNAFFQTQERKTVFGESRPSLNFQNSSSINVNQSKDATFKKNSSMGSPLDAKKYCIEKTKKLENNNDQKALTFKEEKSEQRDDYNVSLFETKIPSASLVENNQKIKSTEEPYIKLTVNSKENLTNQAKNDIIKNFRISNTNKLSKNTILNDSIDVSYFETDKYDDFIESSSETGDKTLKSSTSTCELNETDSNENTSNILSKNCHSQEFLDSEFLKSCNHIETPVFKSENKHDSSLGSHLSDHYIDHNVPQYNYKFKLGEQNSNLFPNSSDSKLSSDKTIAISEDKTSPECAVDSNLKKDKKHDHSFTDIYQELPNEIPFAKNFKVSEKNRKCIDIANVSSIKKFSDSINLKKDTNSFVDTKNENKLYLKQSNSSVKMKQTSLDHTKNEKQINNSQSQEKSNHPNPVNSHKSNKSTVLILEKEHREKITQKNKFKPENTGSNSLNKSNFLSSNHRKRKQHILKKRAEILRNIQLKKDSGFSNHKNNVNKEPICKENKIIMPDGTIAGSCYTHGAVTTEVPACSEIGLNILKKGGNAVDAAVASTICVGIVNSFSSGIGGGGFMLIQIPQENSVTKTDSFDFRETAPRKIDSDKFKNSPEASKVGGLAVAVPGEIHGLYSAHKKHGKLPWEDLFQESITLANDFEVSDQLSKRLLKLKNFILTDSGLKEIYSRDNKLVETGTRIHRKNYAKTLEILSKDPMSFYKGEIAENLLKTIQKAGGIMDEKDLSEYKSLEREALKGTFRGYNVTTMNIPTSGLFVIEALNILEHFDLKELEKLGESAENSSEYPHYQLLIEIFKFIGAGRGKMADPDFLPGWKQIVDHVVSYDFADSIARKINLNHTLPMTEYGFEGVLPEDHGTTHINVIDDNDMVVSLTSTINLEFGAKFMCQSTGIILNNQMDDFYVPKIKNAFDLAEMPNNIVQPRKKPFSSASPLILSKDNEKVILGAAGGTRIPTSILTVIFHLILGKSMEEAIDAPRIHNQFLPNTTYIENTFEKHIADYLKLKGHNIEISATNAIFTSVQGIHSIQTSNGEKIIQAVSDKRKGGLAAGY